MSPEIVFLKKKLLRIFTFLMILKQQFFVFSLKLHNFDLAYMCMLDKWFNTDHYEI